MHRFSPHMLSSTQQSGGWMYAEWRNAKYRSIGKEYASALDDVTPNSARHDMQPEISSGYDTCVERQHKLCHGTAGLTWPPGGVHLLSVDFFARAHLECGWRDRQRPPLQKPFPAPGRAADAQKRVPTTKSLHLRGGIHRVMPGFAQSNASRTGYFPEKKVGSRSQL
jgi:hypothetical protein